MPGSPDPGLHFNIVVPGGRMLYESAMGGAATAAAPAAHSSHTTSRQEQACLAAVSRQTKNGEVTVLSSEFSQANSLLRIGVGPQQAPWRCLVSNDGVAAEVSFDGSEGRL